MGLQKDITLDTGINLPEAYIVIGSVVYINNYHATVNVNIYKDRQSRTDNKSEVVKFKHLCVNEFQEYFGIDVLSRTDVNIIGQGYLYLKTLSFYTDAIDVLDTKE